MDWRVGIGVDAHPLTPDRPLVLCGVPVPYPEGLAGHSDGDVGLHALCDALLGAMGWGDIGEWFPPSDPAYHGADSRQFVRVVIDRIRSEGWSVVHTDVTLIAEEPRLSPWRAEMRRSVADLVSVDESRVSIKATTANELGFIGRKEGIGALAVVLLIKEAEK